MPIYFVPEEFSVATFKLVSFGSISLNIQGVIVTDIKNPCEIGRTRPSFDAHTLKNGDTVLFELPPNNNNENVLTGAAMAQEVFNNALNSTINSFYKDATTFKKSNNKSALITAFNNLKFYLNDTTTIIDEVNDTVTQIYDQATAMKTTFSADNTNIKISIFSCPVFF